MEYLSDEVFSTTCHETGHTSHVIIMNLGPIHYVQVSRQLQESCATGINGFLHIMNTRREELIIMVKRTSKKV